MQDGIPGGRVTIDISDAVAEVALNRPDRLNALDPLMFEALAAAGERLSRTAGVRAVVLTGAGRRRRIDRRRARLLGRPRQGDIRENRGSRSISRSLRAPSFVASRRPPARRRSSICGVSGRRPRSPCLRRDRMTVQEVELGRRLPRRGLFPRSLQTPHGFRARRLSRALWAGGAPLEPRDVGGSAARTPPAPICTPTRRPRRRSNRRSHRSRPAGGCDGRHRDRRKRRCPGAWRRLSPSR